MDEVKKRDLRAELLAAEQEARNKKRKAEGKPPLPVENGSSTAELDEEANKRRKLLQDALEMDKDDDDEEEDEDHKGSKAKDDEADGRRVIDLHQISKAMLNLWRLPLVTMIQTTTKMILPS